MGKASVVVPKVIEHRAIRLDTTHDFLDKLMELYGLKTDYELHKLLEVRKQAIYRYRANATSMDDEICIRVADLITAKAPHLHITADYVMARMAQERAQRPAAKEWWRRAAEKLKEASERAAKDGWKVLAAVAIGTAGLVSSQPSSAATLHKSNYEPSEVHIVQFGRRLRQRGSVAFDALLAWLMGWARILGML